MINSFSTSTLSQKIMKFFKATWIDFRPLSFSKLKKKLKKKIYSLQNNVITDFCDRQTVKHAAEINPSGFLLLQTNTLVN